MQVPLLRHASMEEIRTTLVMK